MGTLKEDLRRWFLEGVRDKATHMIIVCDTYDHEDYPVFVAVGEDVRKVVGNYNGKDMQRVMEVYDLRMDMEEQLRQDRVFNF